MRNIIVKFAVVACSVVAIHIASATEPTETGRQIVTACKAYLQLPPDAAENALHPQHHCRKFIASFLSAYATAERLKPEAQATGVGSSAIEKCVRLPAYLSFRDMAARMIAHAERDPSTLDKPATELARQTLEHDFPCELQK